MNIRKYLWTLAAAATIGFGACSDDDNFDPFAVAPEPPVPNVTPEPPTDKPKAMWIDCHANFVTLSTKAGIDAELAKIKRYGFNMIYLDVKPGNGYALYKSDFLPYCNTYADLTVTRDYDDYLGYFLERCEELDIDVVASIGAMGYGVQGDTGSGVIKQGLIFDQWDKWKSKCQVRSDQNDPNKLVPIYDDLTQPIVLLTPSDPDVQDLLARIASEIVTKYPKIKGISLDYCRYNNNDGGWYGMGDADLNRYAEYWNESKPVHTEIVTATGGVGPKFAKWLEYRSMQVHNAIKKVHDAVKAINPDIEIHLWASADWVSRYSVGQNWASKNYKPSGFQYTETYNQTGFADLLDVFITGAYCQKVWRKEDPSTIWTVENFVKTWDNYIMGDCKCYGSIATYALDPTQMTDATYLCLKYTDGYMNFELSHQNGGNKWIATQKGFNRYMGIDEE